MENIQIYIYTIFYQTLLEVVMKKNVLLLLLLSIVCTACSDEKTEPVKKPQETAVATKEPIYEKKEIEYYETDQLSRPLTEEEKKFFRKPGLYSGEKYDEALVNKQLDTLPIDLTADEYFDELLYLLAEDFHEEVETFVNFDSTVAVDIERPDESIETPDLKQTHYAILIDASGSMRGKVSEKVKMEAAKSAVKEFTKNIPESSTLSLTVYGHKGTNQEKDKPISCKGIKTIYNGHYQEQAVTSEIDRIKPAGWTPISAALTSVAKDIPEHAGDVVVYVVSDGIETCGGDPVKEASNLAEANIKTVVNIIGFDVDNEGQKLLKEVADAGNGEFTFVNSEQELKKYMRIQYEEIQKRWLEWKEAGKKEALRIKEEKKKLAIDTKERMKAKSEREKERLKAAQAYLKEKFEKKDPNHSIRHTDTLITFYSRASMTYAVTSGNNANTDSIINGNKVLNEFINEGNQKINETIDKKNNDD